MNLIRVWVVKLNPNSNNALQLMEATARALDVAGGQWWDGGLAEEDSDGILPVKYDGSDYDVC